MEHLYKKGERRCYVCKKIFTLNSDNFCRDKASSLGFTYRCKECEKIIGKKRIYKYKYRPRNNKRRLKLRFDVLNRDNFTCQYCGRKAPNVILEIDHIHPKSKGGINDLNNYATSCIECNRGKGDTLITQ